MIRKSGIALLLVIAALWLNNTSLFMEKPPDKPQLIAHRGVHQEFTREGLTTHSCTATMIFEPRHTYLENTLPSIRAAIAHGAASNEIDIQLTHDGQFAVFHDHTLECRTNGSGKIRDHSLADLKTLDIGYGYTADNGRSFPFRGKYVGAMPSLTEVMGAFPDGRFILNLKSNRTGDAEALAALVRSHTGWAGRIDAVVTSNRAAEVLGSEAPELRPLSRRTARQCAVRYLLTGWAGHVPRACHNTSFVVPMNYRHLMWGWPHRLAERMDRAGSTVLVFGPYHRGDPGTVGINAPEELDRLPRKFDGYYMTDRIEIIGPVLNSAE